MMVFGGLFNVIGNNMPIVKTYLGGGAIVCIFASAGMVTAGIIPEAVVKNVDAFMNTTGFLNFYIAALITGSILGMNRSLLLRASVRFLPVALCAMTFAILMVGVAGMVLGYGFSEAIMYVAIPMMGIGMILALSFYLVGTILNKLVPAIRTYAWMIIAVAVSKAAGFIPAKFEQAAKQWSSFVMGNWTQALLVDYNRCQEGIMKRRTIEEQLYVIFSGGILLMVAASMIVTLYYSILLNQRRMDGSISDMAMVLSSSPVVVDTLEGRRDPEILGEFLDHVREATDNLDVITVCDAHSLRVYHPEKSEIGKRFIGGDEGPVLHGTDSYITDGTGTLGSQRRAFHVVKNKDGEIIGFVMAAVFTENLRHMRQDILKVYGLLAVLLLGAGIFQIRHVMGRLKKVLMGYKPEEFATKYVERSEVLDMMEEGIFAVNPEGRVILMNRSARALLGVEEGRMVEGELLADLYPETRLPEVMETRKPQYNMSMQMNHNHILATRLPLMEGDAVTGAVSIFRDKTEVMELAEQLTGASYMLDTLRAFNHEFLNKLHVILGYLQLGNNQEAIDYIMNTTLVSSQAVKEVPRQIPAAHLAALLIGKMMQAGELGIRLFLTPDSYCDETSLLMPADCYVAIIGNLLENAIEELNAHNYPVKEIRLGIYCDGKGSGCLSREFPQRAAAGEQAWRWSRMWWSSTMER